MAEKPIEEHPESAKDEVVVAARELQRGGTEHFEHFVDSQLATIEARVAHLGHPGEVLIFVFSPQIMAFIPSAAVPG